MKTKKDYGKKKISGKKHNSMMKNRKRTRMININNLNGGGNSVASKNKYIPPFKRVTRTKSTLRRKSKSTENIYIPPKSMYELKPITSNIYRDLTSDEAELRKKMDANNIKIIESTNSFYQLHYQYKDDKDDKLDTKDLFFIFNPDALSVDKLQYFINTGKISILDDGNYISINENTIILKGFKTGGQYRTGSSNEFIDVYESVEIPMISYETNLQELKKPDLKLFKSTVKRSNVANAQIEKLSEITKDVVWLRLVMDDLNSIEQGNTDTNINLFLSEYKDNNITSETKIFTCPNLNLDHTKLIIDEISIGNEEYIIVGYPTESMRIYLDLYNKNKAEFDKIHKSFKGTEDEDNKDNFMTYMAELHNSIYDNIDKPDPLKHINTDTKHTIEKEIHKFYGYEDYYKYIANFYENELLKDITSEKKDTFEKKKDLNNLLNKEYGIKYDSEFQNKFKTLQEEFYNELALKCLNKPILNINYVFVIFKKYKKDGNYVPALFNFRELTHKHHPILQRLERLIKTRLAKIYGIIDEESNKTKEDYKLWYSHYNYGDVFHIKTEYVHTMSNIQQQAYKYKNSISLEELIYMLSIPNVDLVNLRLDYQKKNNEFSIINGEIQSNNLSDSEDKSLRNKCNKSLSKSKKSNSFVNKFEFGKHIKILLMFLETGKKYIFIYKNMRDNKFYILKFEPNLCNNYISIINYLIDHKLINKLKDDLLTTGNDDLNKSIDIKTNIGIYKITEHRPITQEDFNSIMRYNPLLMRILKKQNTDNIIFITNLFESPLIKLPFDKVKLLKYNIMTIPNPYNHKPFIIRNILATETYQSEFEKFKKQYKTNKTNNSYIYKENIEELNKLNDKLKNKNISEDQYKIDYDKFINKSNKIYPYEFIKGLKQDKKGIIIHSIYFNPDNCGYNLIELIEATKSVIWVVPLNSTYNEKLDDEYTEFNKNKLSKLNSKYIGNFTNLNNSHISLLNVINNIYYRDNKECFINISSNQAIAYCLHIHVIKNESYKSTFAILEQGSRLEKMLSTKTAINLLNLEIKFKTEYYNNFINDVLINDKQ